MPDFDADLCLWLVSDRGLTDAVFGDAPVSADLRQSLNAWRETYEHDCYFRQDTWVSQAAYEEFRERGWLLWARCNRELIGLGYVVDAFFAGYPSYLGTLPSQPVRRRRRGRLRRPVPARWAHETIDRANMVLGRYGEPLIAPAVEPVPVAKHRRRRHWR
jgi:hypothetical protein